MLPVCGKRKNIYLNVYRKIGGGYTIKCSKMLNIAGKNWSERRLVFIIYTLILFEIFIWVHFSPEKKEKKKMHCFVLHKNLAHTKHLELDGFKC